MPVTSVETEKRFEKKWNAKKRLKYQPPQMLEGNAKLLSVVMRALPILDEQFHPARRLVLQAPEELCRQSQLA